MNLSASGHEQFSRILQNGIARYERSGQLFVTSFLTPAEQMLAQKLCSFVPHVLIGGREQPVRARLVIGIGPDDLQRASKAAPDPNLSAPTGMEEKEGTEEEWENWTEESWGQSLASQRYSEGDFVQLLYSPCSFEHGTLRHSDVLGALIHAGIERNAIGDIAVDETGIFVAAQSVIARFVMESLRQIGRVPVLFEPAGKRKMPPAVFEPLKINTASMRADCIVAALAHCSRAQAKALIAQGGVKVNDEVLESVRSLCNNDTISVRRTGKFRIGELDGVSRKGRLIVHIDKYQ